MFSSKSSSAEILAYLYPILGVPPAHPFTIIERQASLLMTAAAMHPQEGNHLDLAAELTKRFKKPLGSLSVQPLSHQEIRSGLIM